MKHLTLLPLGALLAVTLLLTVSVPSAGAVHPDLSGPLPPHSPPSAMQAVAFNPFGVQLQSGATDPNFVPVLTQAQALGVRWVRVYLAWYGIQPFAPATPGCDNCDWTYPDLLFATLAAQGLTPIVTLGGNPSWAAPTPDGPIDDDHLPYFGAFMSELAKRYYSQVQYWEFYNEPDNWASLGDGWGGQGAQYAKMLTTAYNAVHPTGSLVVFGGVAAEGDACAGHPNNTCFDTGFLTDVQSGAPLFDVMAFHFYAGYAKRYSPQNVVGKALKLKQSYPTLLWQKRFLVTELGKAYESGTDKTYSHDLAARQVVQMFAALMTGKWYGVNILSGTWFTLEHAETLAGTATRKWGLLDENDVPWWQEGGAYRTAVSELSNTTYVGPIVGVGVTGYKFSLGDDPVHPTIHAVVWATNPLATVLPKLGFKVTTPSLRWLNKVGRATTVWDNSRADPDKRKGWIRLTITPSPIFVEYK